MVESGVMKDERPGFLAPKILDPAPPPTSRTKKWRITLWIHEKADTDTVQTARKLWKREFCWKDIAKLRFTAFRLKSARSYAERTLKGQVAVEKDGSPWKYWRMSY